MSDRLSLVGDPSLATDPAYCGHLCNDGASLCIDDALSSKQGSTSSTDGKSSSPQAGTSDVDVAAYSRLSASRANAAQLPLEGGAHFATIATRTIAAGEEVLISYGAGYWLSRAGISAEQASNSSPKTSRSTSKQGASKPLSNKKKLGFGA